MALNVVTLVARVVADTEQFNRGMAGVQGRIATTGQSMMRAGSVLTRGLTIPLLATAGAAIKFGVDFQRQMEYIHTQAGKSQHEVDKMTGAVLRLAPATMQGPVELAKALYHIESVGAHGAAALNILKVSAQGAAVGNANLEDTASALAGMMRVFHIEAGGAAQVMGELNAIVGAGNMRMTDLNHAISTGLFPTAKGLGMNIQEVGAALATMTDESVPAQVAATRMRTLFLLMSGETKKSTDTLKTLGIGQLDLAHAMARPGGMINALMIMKEHLDKFTKDPALQTQFLAKAFGGARSSGTIIQLLNNLEMVHQKLTQINGTAGNFPQAVIATQATNAFKLHQAWSAVQTTLIKIGGTIIPIFTSMVQTVARLASAFGNLSPDTQRFIVELGLIAAGAGPVLFIIGALIAGVGALLSPLGLAVAAMVALGIAADKMGQIKGVAGAVVGAGIAFAAYTLAVNGASLAETAFIKGLYLMDAAFAASGVGAFAIVLGGLLGYLLATSQRTDRTAQAFNDAVSSIYAYRNAVLALANTHLELKDRQLAVKMAQLEVDRTQKALTAQMKLGNMASIEGRQALYDHQGALLRLKHAQAEVTAAQGKDTAGQKKAAAEHKVAAASVRTLTKHYQDQKKALEDATHSNTPYMLSMVQGKIAANDQAGVARHLVKALDDIAVKNARVAAANKTTHPAIARTAAAIRDQALATAGLARKLHEVPDAVSKSKAGAQAEAQTLGLSITTGIVSGLGGVGAAIVSSVQPQIFSAIAQLKAQALQAKSPSKLTADHLGKPMAEGIIWGYLVGIRDLPEKMKKSLQNALEAGRKVIEAGQSKVSNAWSRLADYAMRAFDARTEAHVTKMTAKFNKLVKDQITDPMNAALKEAETQHNQILDAIEKARAELTPAEAALKALQSGHDEQGRMDAMQSAQEALSKAQAGGDPEAIKAAQRAVAEALYQQQVATLQLQAETERQAKDAQAAIDRKAEDDRYAVQQQGIHDMYDAMLAAMTAVFDKQVLNYRSLRDLQKQHLQDQLDDMEKYLEKHPHAWRRIHRKIMHMFHNEFGPDFKEAGANLGIGFAQGLREAVGDVGGAADYLAKQIAKYLKLHSPAELGPLSDLHKWWTPLGETLVSGLDLGAVQQASKKLAQAIAINPDGSIGTLSAGAASRIGGQSGAVVNHFNIEGSVIHERELLEIVRKQGIRHAARGAVIGLT